MLGVLCDASTLLDATVVKLLILGMLSLLLSGIGGIIGGYVVYFFKKGKFNPTVGMSVDIVVDGKDEEEALQAMEKFLVCE